MKDTSAGWCLLWVAFTLARTVDVGPSARFKKAALMSFHPRCLKITGFVLSRKYSEDSGKGNNLSYTQKLWWSALSCSCCGGNMASFSDILENKLPGKDFVSHVWVSERRHVWFHTRLFPPACCRGRGAENFPSKAHPQGTVVAAAAHINGWGEPWHPEMSWKVQEMVVMVTDHRQCLKHKDLIKSKLKLKLL